MDEKTKRIIKRAERAVNEWRLWHRPTEGCFPSDGLISAMHSLDSLFPGTKAEKIADED